MTHPALVLALFALVSVACTPATGPAAPRPDVADPEAVTAATDESPAGDVRRSSGPDPFDAPPEPPADMATSAPVDPCASAQVPATAPQTLLFASRNAIPACIAFRPTAEGGRKSPVFRGYRPTVSFATPDAAPAAATAQVCTFAFEARSVAPGSTVAGTLTCNESAEVFAEANAFAVFEGGRTVATGHVVFPEDG